MKIWNHEVWKELSILNKIKWIISNIFVWGILIILIGDILGLW